MLTTLLLSPHSIVNMVMLGAMDRLPLVPAGGLLLLLPHPEPTQYLVNIPTNFCPHPKRSNGASHLVHRRPRHTNRLPPAKLRAYTHSRSIQSTGRVILPIPACSPPGMPHSLRHLTVLGRSKILQLVKLVLSMGVNPNLDTSLAMRVHPMPHHLVRHNHRCTPPWVAHKPILTRTTRINVRPTPYRSALFSFDLVHCADPSLYFARSHVSFGSRFLPRLFATD